MPDVSAHSGTGTVPVQWDISRTLRLTMRDEDVVHHVPDSTVTKHDQHRHYQISS